jgi:hypothetical protein
MAPGRPLRMTLKPPDVTLKWAGLEPDTIGIRNPATIVFQVDVGNEVFAASSIRIEAVGETIEGSDRQCTPLV